MTFSDEQNVPTDIDSATDGVAGFSLQPPHAGLALAAALQLLSECMELGGAAAVKPTLFLFFVFLFLFLPSPCLPRSPK